LDMRGIVIDFNGVKALDGIDLKVRAGEIVGLCGEVPLPASYVAPW